MQETPLRQCCANGDRETHNSDRSISAPFCLFLIQRLGANMLPLMCLVVSASCQQPVRVNTFGWRVGAQGHLGTHTPGVTAELCLPLQSPRDTNESRLTTRLCRKTIWKLWARGWQGSCEHSRSLPSREPQLWQVSCLPDCLEVGRTRSCLLFQSTKQEALVHWQTDFGKKGLVGVVEASLVMFLELGL